MDNECLPGVFDKLNGVWCGTVQKIVMRVKIFMTHLVNRAKISHDVLLGAHEGENFHDKPCRTHEGEIFHDTPRRTHEGEIFHDTPRRTHVGEIFHDTPRGTHEGEIFYDIPHGTHEGEIFHDTPRGTHEGEIIPDVSRVNGSKIDVKKYCSVKYRTTPRIAIGPNPTFLYSTRIGAKNLQMAWALRLYPQLNV